MLKESKAGSLVLNHLIKLSRDIEVLEALYDFVGSWEAVIWLLRTVARMATGNLRSCEFLYLCGHGSSGNALPCSACWCSSVAAWRTAAAC